MNHYERLGINCDCDQKLIGPAFRNKIKHVHPDKNIFSEQPQFYQQATNQLYEAYRILSNTETRLSYDRQLESALKKQQTGYNRYFQESNIFQQNGKWYTQCQQCQGKTEIEEEALQTIIKKEKHYFLKCWHCNLALQILVE